MERFSNAGSNTWCDVESVVSRKQERPSSEGRDLELNDAVGEVVNWERGYMRLPFFCGDLTQREFNRVYVHIA